MSLPRCKRSVDLFVATAFCLLTFINGALGQSDQPEVRYNRDVLPILAEHCFSCHGFDEAARQAGLRLDSAANANAQLESGAKAIVPGDVAASELIKRIFSADAETAMPPLSTNKPLTSSQKRTLQRWVEQGAPYEPHWAYVPPVQEQLPHVNGVEHPIDRFIRSRLAQEQILPRPRADRAVLIRRLSLDLTGLPPAPADVQLFLMDSSDEAYERLVDRLLSSPHFGERWARWWLDLAHYADSDGYLQDFLRPVAWRYRQWVVDAFNRDLSFDQFTIEQLAGDLLPNATTTQRIATGFLRNTLSNREGGADLEEYRVNQIVDRTMTFSTTWLGLTVGCAQCHDHKFDAISQREFYQLYAFFNDTDEVNFNAPLPGELEPWAHARQTYDRRRAELLAPAAESLAEMQADWERRLLEAETQPDADFAWQRALEVLGLVWGQGLGEGQLEGINILHTPPEQRTQEQRDRLLDYFLAQAPEEYSAGMSQINAAELRGKLDALKQELPPISRAPGVMQTVNSRPTHVHLRGDFRRKGDTVMPVTPAVLPAFAPDRPADSKADRLALAKWLVSAEHPLTARITVNRIWQELFGRGIVATSENFGVRGSLPSHPELLDWLAVEFRHRGWSVKELVRLIVTSETYRQSSRARPELAAHDPDNALLARQNRLRLTAEAVRDSALAVSGLLTGTIGGPSVRPPQPASVSLEGYDNKWEASTGADRYRRGLYTFLQRTSPYAQSITFDLPDTSRTCTRRERSNSPLQALTLLNDPVFAEAAQALGARVLRESGNTPDERLQYAFLLTLARSATSEESRRLLAFLHEQQTLFESDPEAARTIVTNAYEYNAESEAASSHSVASNVSSDGLPSDTAERAAWNVLCSVLLNLDEFINRE